MNHIDNHISAGRDALKASGHVEKQSYTTLPVSVPVSVSVPALTTGKPLIDNPLRIMSIILAGYFVSSSRSSPFASFLFISNKVGVDAYAKSTYDIAFVSFYILFFTVCREFWIEYVFYPLAEKLDFPQSKRQRFVEQAYAFLYFSVSSTVGLVVMSREDTWFFNTDAFWNFPQITMPGLFKVYYLLQLAYWLQQIIVLAFKLEKPRKDYNELIIHHVVTVSLVLLSYYFNFTLVGNAVFLTMDISDVWLSASKMLNYHPKTVKLSEFVFAIFVVIWTYFRHYLYGLVIIPSAWNFLDIAPEKGLDWERELYVCPLAWKIMLGLMIPLQLVCIFWYVLILRILYKAVTGQQLEDEREKDDGAESEERERDQVNIRNVAEKEADALEDRRDERDAYQDKIDTRRAKIQQS